MTLRRPKKPGSRRDLKRTPAQETAFRVFRLRGLFYMAYALTGSRREAMQRLVDAEISRLGAEPEGDRYARKRGADQEVPF